MPSLNVELHGTGSPLLWLHGFTQTNSSAHVFTSILAAHCALATPDLPGHGQARDLRGNLEEISDLVADVLPRTPCDLGGYSFGGRVALHVALRHPEKIRRLILLSATRGIEDIDERRSRRERDERLAERIELIGTDSFIDEWLAQPMFEGLANDEVERNARRRQSPLGLASSLRLAGTGTQEWLGEKIESLTMPVLLMAGERDEKFLREAVAMASDIPGARCVVIANAGHAAHLEQPDAVANAILEFFDEANAQ